MKISRYRDLTIIEDEGKKLIIACDSSGGIGPKQLDVVKVDGYIVGRFLTRVVLMELISVGAKPVAIIDTLAVEMNPTGVEIIEGIIEETEQININGRDLLNGSTEENILVQQTGVGITAIGYCHTLHVHSFPGDYLVCIGNPKVGAEVFLDDEEICDLLTIQQIRNIRGVHEIVPVGSKGVMYEITELLNRNQLTYTSKEVKLDVMKSAGPVTCAIITLTEEALDQVKKFVRKPLHVMGYVSKKTF